jgi:hypothetical protein
MPEEFKTPPQAPPSAMEPAVPQPPGERFRELAELEQAIRQRLRSNQRFLERFLDEDFVDDEADGNEDQADSDAEEL